MDKAIATHQGDGVSFQHLRRLVKDVELPNHLRNHIITTRREEADVTNKNPELSDPEIVHSIESSRPCDDADLANVPPTDSNLSAKNSLQLMIYSNYVTPLEDIYSRFSTVTKIIPHVLPTVPTIHKILVPLHPPTSAEQAREWSQLYWPTVWKKYNPKGPQPSIVSRGTKSITDRVGAYMILAKQAAHEARDAGFGEAIGAVIVNPLAPSQAGGDKTLPAVVVAAGDGRWAGCSRAQHKGPGIPTEHAVMRAIALVARKRRELASRPRAEPRVPAEAFGDVFQVSSMLPVEHFTFSNDTLAPNGYLCTSMEIYITHEPCVMCSMAILHSRFDKVVFAKEMPQTGAMIAESARVSGLQQPEDTPGKQGDGACHSGYGLFWRDELNWKVLAWQFIELDIEEEESGESQVPCNVHA